MFDRYPVSPWLFLMAFALLIAAAWSGAYASVVLAGAAAALFAAGMLLGLECWTLYKLSCLKRDSRRRLQAD